MTVFRDHIIIKETAIRADRLRVKRRPGNRPGDKKGDFGMKILNFGSLNIDRVYTVPHFVRPGETLSSSRYQVHAGGKGLNQSIALAKAGAQVYHAGKIGADGQFLRELLEHHGVDTSYLSVTDGATGHAVIQVDPSGQNCILLFGGANQEIGPADVDRVLAGFEAGDVLLLQNEISSLDYLMEAATRKGLRIALNPSPISPELKEYDLSHVAWFLLNEIEGEELSGKHPPEEICRELLARYPEATVVLTLGKKGVLCADAQGIISHGIYDVPVVDTTAAGDTFTGYFLAGVLSGLSNAKCLEQASVASSLAIGKPGAAESIPDKDEVAQKQKLWL